MAANAYAYGFVDLAHLMADRVTAVGEATVFTAIQESAAEHTRAVNAILGAFVNRTTAAQQRFYLPGSDELQPLDRQGTGNPIPVRPSGYYDIAFPIRGAGTAWGDNRVSRALMTVEEANRNTVNAMMADSRWIKRHVLAALLDKTTETFADESLGNLTIQPLANGDAVLYNRLGGTAATDTHYIAQAAAIADATNPFPSIYTELSEHPSNSGPYVAYIATNLVSTTEALTNFVPVSDPDIMVGSGTDTLNGTFDRGVGDTVLGKVDKVWVVEWKSLPDDYIIAHARGAGAVLGMREFPAPALQGFFTENNSPDGNLQEMRMIRYAGFGVQNRVAALAYFVSAGDVTFDVPTGYAHPQSY